jgi:hypothetical protein
MNLNGYHIAALALSVAAHGMLGFAYMNGGQREEVKFSSPMPSIAVSLVASSNNANLLGLVTSQSRQVDTSSHAVTEQQSISPVVATENSLVDLHKPAEPYYFPAKELSERPLVMQDIPPDVGVLFPDMPAQNVIVWLLINEAGEVDQVKLERFNSLPDDAELLLQQVFANIKFYPGKINGLAVKSKIKIEIAIEPPQHNVSSSKRSLSP